MRSLRSGVTNYGTVPEYKESCKLSNDFLGFGGAIVRARAFHVGSILTADT